MNFNPNLEFGYRKRMELEPDLIDSQERIIWSEHIVIVYPVWWGSFPAIMKGFFDRTLLAPFSYKKRENRNADTVHKNIWLIPWECNVG